MHLTFDYARNECLAGAVTVTLTVGVVRFIAVVTAVIDAITDQIARYAKLVRTSVLATVVLCKGKGKQTIIRPSIQASCHGEYEPIDLWPQPPFVDMNLHGRITLMLCVNTVIEHRHNQPFIHRSSSKFNCFVCVRAAMSGNELAQTGLAMSIHQRY